MPANGHNSISLTVNSFQNFIRNCLRDEYICYIIFAWSVHDYFKPLQSLTLLDVIYETDEAVVSFYNNQLVSNFHDYKGHCNSMGVGMIVLDVRDV